MLSNVVLRAATAANSLRYTVLFVDYFGCKILSNMFAAILVCSAIMHRDEAN